MHAVELAAYVSIGVTVQVVADVKRTVATRQKSLTEQLPEDVPASTRDVRTDTGVLPGPQKILAVAMRPAAVLA